MDSGIRLPQFVPILTSFAERVSRSSLQQLLLSPSSLARALAETQTVVGHDGILCVYHKSLLPRACTKQKPGASPELLPAEDVPGSPGFSALLEAIRSLRHRAPANTRVLASFAGPGLLHAELSEGACRQAAPEDREYAAEVLLGTVRAALEAKADGVALMEEAGTLAAPELAAVYGSLRKLADFYESALVLFVADGAPAVGWNPRAHCTFYLPSGSNGFELVPGILDEGLGAAVPFTTAADVPAETPVEQVRLLCQRAQDRSRAAGEGFSRGES
jgi:hypothetical protein